MMLSQHFSLEELTRSDYALRNGIDNDPPIELLESGKMLAAGLERVRSVLAVPIHISSGYRCRRLNAAIGGASSSQHVKFLAADILAPEYGDPYAVCQAILDHEDFIAFDQLIYEGTWTHVSFGQPARGEVLTAHFGGGAVSYSRGLSR